MSKFVWADKKIVTIDQEHAGQRIDNYLFTSLKTVPKSHIYQLLRKGAIKINGRKTAPSYRLTLEDTLLLPSLYQTPKVTVVPSEIQIESLLKQIIYEDEQLIVIDKPSGWPVHAGSGYQFGVIETLRYSEKWPKLELVHRLDRATSGCLMLAKTRKSLLFLQEQLQAKKLIKTYYALVHGIWPEDCKQIDVALSKNPSEIVQKKSFVDQSFGKKALTRFKLLAVYKENAIADKQYSWIEAKPITGRTHQIRIHTAYVGHPIINDEKYGAHQKDRNFRHDANKKDTLYLHASSLLIPSYQANETLRIEAPMPEIWDKLINRP